MTPSRDADIAIVGAGIIGAALARFLAEHGRSVILLERDAEPSERAHGRATASSLGVLNLPRTTRSPLGRLHALGIALWPSWAKRLRDETGIDPQYDPCGGLHLLEEVPAAAARERLVDRYARAGFRAAWLDPAELRDQLPAAATSFRTTLHLPEEARVSPSATLRALLSSCRRRGVDLRTETGAAEVVAGNPPSIALLDGTSIRCNAIVVAAGAWSSRLLDASPCAHTVRVRPVRGQAIAVRSDLPAGSTLHFELAGARRSYYLLPHGNGTAWVGATVEEDAGFESKVTPAGLEELLAAARALLGDIDESAIVDAWAGLRPQARRRGGPFLGPLTGAAGVWAACGHYRTGVLTAPPTAELLGRALLDQARDEDRELLAAFAP